MALGNNSNGKSDTALVILKPVSQDAEGKKVEPHFAVSRKDPTTGKFVKTQEVVSMVAGNLKSVKVTNESYQNSDYKKVVVLLEDEVSKESYLLDLRFNMGTRNLFNMLATLNSGEDIKISYYTAKNGYDRYSVRQSDNLVEWKHSFDALPKPTEVTFKGKVQRDYTVLDELFEKELLALNTRLGGKASASKPTGQAKVAEATASTDGPADEPVPF